MLHLVEDRAERILSIGRNTNGVGLVIHPALHALEEVEYTWLLHNLDLCGFRVSVVQLREIEDLFQGDCLLRSGTREHITLRQLPPSWQQSGLVVRDLKAPLPIVLALEPTSGQPHLFWLNSVVEQLLCHFQVLGPSTLYGEDPTLASKGELFRHLKWPSPLSGQPPELLTRSPGQPLPQALVEHPTLSEPLHQVLVLRRLERRHQVGDVVPHPAEPARSPLGGTGLLHGLQVTIGLLGHALDHHLLSGGTLLGPHLGQVEAVGPEEFGALTTVEPTSLQEQLGQGIVPQLVEQGDKVR